MAFSPSKYIRFAGRLCQHPVKELRRKFGPSDAIPFATLAQYIPSSPVILEAGAADGSDTLRMCQFWPSCQIHAFEPVPVAFEKLQSKCQLLPNVRTYLTALSDREGTAEMYISNGPSRTDSSSLLLPTGHLKEDPAVKFDTRLVVPTIRMDDWAQRHGVDRVDLMWLDMQGYELNALKHGTKLLRSVSAVHMEVLLKELYAGTPGYPEVKQWMAEQGLIVAVEAMLGAWGNVLFARR